ncbi:MAG: hypothetical protein ACYTFW_02865 [Planctomycetota bacterium]
MYSVNIEQIFEWFVKSLWTILKEHATLISTIWAAIATTYIIFLIRRSLPKAEPDIKEAQVRIDPCDLPSFRFFKGSFVAINSGRKRCNLIGLRVLHESLKFEISYIVDERRGDLAAHDKDTTSEQLPLLINRNKKKRIFFAGIHEVVTFAELPENLSLEVTFDCRKEPFLYSMVRKLNSKKYVLYQP